MQGSKFASSAPKSRYGVKSDTTSARSSIKVGAVGGASGATRSYLVGRWVALWVDHCRQTALDGERHRPTAPYQAKYQWGYIYSAADVVTGEAEFLYTPTVSFKWTNEFLEQLSVTDPKAVHIVIWDRAGFHLFGPKKKSYFYLKRYHYLLETLAGRSCTALRRYSGAGGSERHYRGTDLDN
jgi:hypothetical protein